MFLCRLKRTGEYLGAAHYCHAPHFRYGFSKAGEITEASGYDIRPSTGYEHTGKANAKGVGSLVLQMQYKAQRNPYE